MTAGPWTPPAALVQDALQAVAAARPAQAQERYEQLAWSALLRTQGPGLLTRAWAPMHLTASAAVLDPAGAQTCLVLHHKLGVWVQPGGHLEDGDESVLAAAAREVAEETGLTGRVLPAPALLSRHPAPCAPGVVDWHLDVQFALVTQPTPPRSSSETPQVGWFPVSQLPAPIAPGVAELVASAVTLLTGSSLTR